MSRPDSSVARSDIELVTFGETLGSFRSIGRIASGSSFSVSPAGAESNVAIALSRLGHGTAWVGRVGADPIGHCISKTLRGEGVNVTGLVEDPDSSTGTMVVEDRAPLPPYVVYYRAGSAGSRLDSDAVTAAIELHRPAVVHLTGITPALSINSVRVAEAGIKAARSVSALVSFDVNFRKKLWSTDAAAAKLAPLAQKSDVVIASEPELELVAPGETSAERAEALLRVGVRTVVVKLGRDGAESYDSSGRRFSPALSVLEVDSIGAGDAFVGGYLSALLDGLLPQQQLARGCAVGAFAVSGRGDWERTPTRDELELLVGGEREASR